MAVDEFLLSRLPVAPATFLRLYSWKRPTASLGRSQETEKAVDADFCRNKGVDIVRRITGGKMVLHDREVTYSLFSSDEELFSATLRESYRRISAALALGLHKMGLRPELAGVPPEEYARGTLPCFSQPGRDELHVAGKKILGSAQKRLEGKFLQHGSLPLEHDEALLRSVAGLSAADRIVNMTSLGDLLGRRVSWDEAADRLREGLAEFFGVDMENQHFSPEEAVVMRRLQREKYEDERWTFFGLPPKTIV